MTTAQAIQNNKQVLAKQVLNLRKLSRKESYLIGHEPVWENNLTIVTRYSVQVEITTYSTGTVYMEDENGVSLFFWNIETAAEFITEIV